MNSGAFEVFQVLEGSDIFHSGFLGAFGVFGVITDTGLYIKLEAVWTVLGLSGKEGGSLGETTAIIGGNGGVVITLLPAGTVIN